MTIYYGRVLTPDEEQWFQYWQAKGFPWRREPEIDTKRQEELHRYRTGVPHVTFDPFRSANRPEAVKQIEHIPFRGVKLNRADVEWLLATHEPEYEPVLWRERGDGGIDLREADLERADLSALPLSRAHMERARLSEAHLVGADLSGAHLEGAHLEGADLGWAHLEGAHLEGAHLEGAHLEKAYLGRTHLTGAYLGGVVLNDVILVDNHQVGIYHRQVGPYVLDVRWDETNLTPVDWSQIDVLGEEAETHTDWKESMRNCEMLGMQGEANLRKKQGMDYYKKAVRANRQLAVALEAQGLNEDAALFAYRAQVLQRKLFRGQGQVGRWFFSLLLAIVAGYGYRMRRILFVYALTVTFCATAYYVLGQFYGPHLSFLDALLVSITAFHGRVFSEPFLQPGQPQLWVTAFEAIMGLLVESVFIAMLTQKVFGK